MSCLTLENGSGQKSSYRRREKEEKLISGNSMLTITGRNKAGTVTSQTNMD